MPLDAGDIEKITQIVDRATSRIEINIKDLMPRSEYEQRHIEVYTRVLKNEETIQNIVKWAMGEHEKLINKSDVRFSELKSDIKEVGLQVDSVKADISLGRVTTIRYIATVIVSVIIGIAIPVLLKLLGG